MQALMLAAGMGRRLGTYTQNATKCMVPVNGKPLIDYAIKALQQAGIHRLVIVAGYKREHLKTYLSGACPETCGGGYFKKTGQPFTITYIDNPDFASTNNIYSLSLAIQELTADDTILLESDLIFDTSIITELVQSPEKNLAVVSHFEPWMDGTVTLINEKQDITAVIDKANFDWEQTRQYYKTVNIYKFSKEFSRQYYAPFLTAYQTAFGKNEYYEQVLKVLSFLDGASLKAHPVSGDRWHEIDDCADLAVAETKFSPLPRKLELMQQRYGGYWRFPSLLDFCYLVNPYFPPPQLVRELQSNAQPLLTQYPSGDAQQSLLAAKIFTIQPEHIAVGNGAAELISALAGHISGTIAIPYPTFNEYPERFAHAKPVPVPVSRDFSYTIEDILNTVTKHDAKTLLLINPDNPSGHFIAQDQMTALLDELKKRAVRIIFDESFIDFADPGKKYTLITEQLLSEYPNLIVVKSISKSYGVPGLRLGVLASGNAQYIKTIQKQTAIWNINSFAEYFLQIYDKYKRHYAAACEQIAQERVRFVSELSKITGITVYPSQANYVLCRLEMNKTARQIAQLLLRDNIFIKDLSAKKGFENGQYIRLAVRDAKDNDRLLSALRAI